MSNINLFIKRLIDIFGSLVGMIITSPVLIIIAVLIKLTSKGSVFYIQDRLGKDGVTFKIIKFRTMVENAENIGSGIHVTENDSRITKIGRFLRKYSLDELPQLFNVLKGDMSLVGPRPLLTHFPKTFDEYDEKERLRFKMKPGITGLAQINGRGSLSWDEKFSYDIRYVSRYSLKIDILILFKTIGCLIKPKNIYKSEEQGVGLET